MYIFGGLCDASSWMSGAIKMGKIKAILASVIPSLVSFHYHLYSQDHRWEPTNIQTINQWLPETNNSVMKEHDNLVKMISERWNVLPRYPFSWVTDFFVSNKHCSSFFSLSFATLWANAADDKLIFFWFYSDKKRFDISCKLSPMETICIKYQIWLLGKNKTNISKCYLLKTLPRVLSVK